jgi:hypothetical protein
MIEFDLEDGKEENLCPNVALKWKIDNDIRLQISKEEHKVHLNKHLIQHSKFNR